MKKCIYPWATLVLDNDYIKPCCNNQLVLPYNPSMKLFDVLNSPLFQKLRKSMLDGTSVGDGHCSSNCNYLVTGRASTDSDIALSLPKELIRDDTIVESIPEMVIIHVDSKCNYDCPMCPQINTHDKYVASPALVNLIYQLDAAATYPFRVLWLGGEPFLKRSKDLLLEVNQKTKHCRFCLLTNGSIYDEDLLDKIRLENVTISVDSVDPETYKKIRIHGDFDNVIRNLERLLEYRERTKRKFLIGIICVVMTANYKGLPDLLRFFSKYEGIDLTFQEGRIIQNDMDVFYKCQTDFELKQDFLNVIERCEKMTDEIQKFGNPYLITDSLNLMRLNAENYQIIDHGYVTKQTIL